ncbi:uncharacterized protein LOC144932553 [Lampetra fluviatilis]
MAMKSLPLLRSLLLVGLLACLLGGALCETPTEAQDAEEVIDIDMEASADGPDDEDGEIPNSGWGSGGGLSEQGDVTLAAAPTSAPSSTQSSTVPMVEEAVLEPGEGSSLGFLETTVSSITPSSATLSETTEQAIVPVVGIEASAEESTDSLVQEASATTQSSAEVPATTEWKEVAAVIEEASTFAQTTVMTPAHTPEEQPLVEVSAEDVMLTTVTTATKTTQSSEETILKDVVGVVSEDSDSTSTEGSAPEAQTVDRFLTADLATTAPATTTAAAVATSEMTTTTAEVSTEPEPTTPDLFRGAQRSGDDLFEFSVSEATSTINDKATSETVTAQYPEITSATTYTDSETSAISVTSATVRAILHGVPRIFESDSVDDTTSQMHESTPMQEVPAVRDVVLGVGDEDVVNFGTTALPPLSTGSPAVHRQHEEPLEKTEVLAAVIAGGVVGLFLAAFLVAVLIHRMRKKDEGSYTLNEPKLASGSYQKAPTQEIYA